MNADPLGVVDSDVIDQVVRRASSGGFDTWWARVRASGHCARPIRLSREVDGVRQTVYVRCKDRRAARCPSCSALYAGDTWHLVHAGLAGEDEIPASVGDHPVVFATLTAPSFGSVHSIRSAESRCQPNRHGVCEHGRSRSCPVAHPAGSPIIGQPLCADCYDYTGHALTTWHAPALWHRFTIELRRLVRRHAGSGVRVSFVKVMEMQARAIPHYHAIIRLDAAGDTETPERPPASLDVEQLARLVTIAASRTHLDVVGDRAEIRTLGFGTQIDTQAITRGSSEDAVDRARAIAGYLAKYVTKSTAEFGVSPRRISPAGIDLLDVTPHVRTLLREFADLAATSPDYADMTRWLHTLGYRGHTTSKSRRYSTTMGKLRARRAAHQTSSDEEATDAEWDYVGTGHATTGERYLAVSAALRHQEAIWAARQLGEVSSPIAPAASSDIIGAP